jgi:hypothetical protein
MSKYQTAHNDPTSDTLILCLVDEPDTYTKTTQSQYFKDILSAQREFVASRSVIQGLPDTIDPEKLSKNYKAAMSQPDNPEAYQKEYLGFKERGFSATVVPPKGAKILGTTTRQDYKIDNCVLTKRKSVCA